MLVGGRRMNSLKRFSKNRLFIFAGIILLLISAGLSLTFGSIGFAVGGVIFYYVRLPRTVACILAGAGLAVSGAVLQNVLSNRLASPGILGVNAGAGLGVTVCCAVGILSGWKLALAAFAGSFIAVLIVASTASLKNASRNTVLLGGAAVNSVLNALSEAVAALFPDVASLSAEFRVGGFSSVSHVRLYPAAILIIVSLVVLMTLCNELDVLTLGDDTAHGLGMSVRRTRTIFLILAALLSGAVVSFAGLLGFIGLIVPNFVRGCVDGGSRVLLPSCALYGASFVTVCDLIARTAFAPYELPVGILMSVIGGPLFVFLLFGRRNGGQYD